MNRLVSFLLLLISFSKSTYALAPFKKLQEKPKQEVKLRADCVFPTKSVEQNINNVRALLWNGGDVWWDRTDAKYIIPKTVSGSGVTEVSSMYCAGIWIIGRSQSGTKGAVRMYGGGAKNDWYPGPLVPADGTTEPNTCANWDRIWEVTSKDIDAHKRNIKKYKDLGAPYPDEEIPLNIKGWPGKGNPYFEELNNWELPFTSAALAPFYDDTTSTPGVYDPQNGDFPFIEVRGIAGKCLGSANPAIADQMFFWIVNDNGGPHRELDAGGSTIKMEVQVQAFAFATNDALNDMSFLRYKLINRSSVDITDCFFGFWADSDLGCSLDDVVGCDSSKALVFYYNLDAVDGSSGAQCPISGSNTPTYGNKVPIIGIDYFEGPTIDNEVLGGPPRDTGMTAFTYFNNPSFNNPNPGTGDPSNIEQCYDYMRGIWKDGTPFTVGGTGYNPNMPLLPRTRFPFPSPPNDPTGWNMYNENPGNYDRRTLQVTGIPILRPNKTNYLVVGVPWVANQAYPAPSLENLLAADLICQGLFDNCFKIFDGPDAPDLEIVELDQKLIITLSNDEISNNKNLDFIAFNPGKTKCDDDSCLYKFEGYKVYQLVNELEENKSSYNDLNKARLVAQVDIKNGVTKIYNWDVISNPNTVGNNKIYVPILMVNGGDKGIKSTFELTNDLFSQSTDPRLLNHKKYYYVAVAYAYNNYKTFNIDNGDGQQFGYAEGRRNSVIKTGIPRPITDQYLNADYGDGAIITRLDGKGNNSIFLDLEDGEGERLALNGIDNVSNDTILYREGAGPVQVKIYNPIDVKDGEFIITVSDSDMSDNKLDLNTALWKLEDSKGEVLLSNLKFSSFNEQVIGEFGFSIYFFNSEPGVDQLDNNGFVGISVENLEPTKDNWIRFIKESDTLAGIFNFIQYNNNIPNNKNLDTLHSYENNLFFPAYLALTKFYPNPELNQFAFTPFAENDNVSGLLLSRTSLSDLNNVDIVFTSDRNLWTRCIVVETTNNFYKLSGFLPVGGNVVRTFDLRRSNSISKEVDGNGNPIQETNTGLSWFPGYAIDVETGQRLEIFFGENSSYDPDIFSSNFETMGVPINMCRDMIWNPSKDIGLTPVSNNVGDAFVGGQHFIYVTRRPYNEATFKAPALNTDIQKANYLSTVTWCALPFPTTNLLSYKDGLIPSKSKVKLRVSNSYNTSTENSTFINSSMPKYKVKIKNKATRQADEKLVSKALDSITVVPNPYYAYSDYETSEVTNIVKITNLPPKCQVSIYSIDGTFIRYFNRNESRELVGSTTSGLKERQITPDLEWDLKNSKGITVASGVYLIHVKSSQGERVIKWVGAIRQLDISGF